MNFKMVFPWATFHGQLLSLKNTIVRKVTSLKERYLSTDWHMGILGMDLRLRGEDRFQVRHLQI